MAGEREYIRYNINSSIWGCVAGGGVVETIGFWICFSLDFQAKIDVNIRCP